MRETSVEKDVGIAGDFAGYDRVIKSVDKSEDTSPPELSLTPTVGSALKQFASAGPVSSVEFTQAILDYAKHRTEYADGRFASLSLAETDEKRAVQAWVREIQGLFDPLRIEELGGKQELHGQLAIVGLSLLDQQLAAQLMQNDALPTLIAAIRPPLDQILTARGRDLYDFYLRVTDVFDSVPTWSDESLYDPDEDLLGRAAFARYLAKRIEQTSNEQGAYAIHIYGPWGAGKSTLLNFLRVNLSRAQNKNEAPGPNGEAADGADRTQATATDNDTSKSDWLVVDFNAWRNQHIQPPWWSLMEAVFQQTKSELSFTNRLKEYWWRLTTGRVPQIVTAILLLWLLVLILPWLLQNVIQPLEAEQKRLYEILTTLGEIAAGVGEILALIATVWGGMLIFNRSLLLGSAKAAQSYRERIRDPMNEIRKRFGVLIERLKPHRVAIFIDDLDRCQSSYAVELLEGIQTLFRDAPVVFVVAADRDWLDACYEQVYRDLKAHVYEPGKPLGMLFLEKAFRFSTPLPGIPATLKQKYWRYLLRVKEEQAPLLGAALTGATASVAEAPTEAAVRKLIADSQSQSFVEQRAVREAAVERLAAPEVIDRLEHTLKPYGELLEPNPRAMKRLVNAYSANRALAILSEVDIDLHQLALWTILSLQWPQLTDYFEKSVVDSNDTEIPPELKALINDNNVRHIIQGGGLSMPLQRATVEQCGQIHA